MNNFRLLFASTTTYIVFSIFYPSSGFALFYNRRGSNRVSVGSAKDLVCVFRQAACLLTMAKGDISAHNSSIEVNSSSDCTDTSDLDDGERNRFFIVKGEL